MKKIVYFLLFALCLPIGLLAQSVDDDLYFVPSKDKQEKKETPVKKETKQQVTNIYTSPGTTVVVQDRKGKTRDVDEYNRRYDARDNEFVMDNDTLYIKEKSNPDLDGEWVTGECYQFLDADEGKTALYDPNGYKIEERDMRPEERQRTMFQGIRENMKVQMSKTGTDN